MSTRMQADAGKKKGKKKKKGKDKQPQRKIGRTFVIVRVVHLAGVAVLCVVA